MLSACRRRLHELDPLANHRCSLVRDQLRHPRGSDGRALVAHDQEVYSDMMVTGAQMMLGAGPNQISIQRISCPTHFEQGDTGIDRFGHFGDSKCHTMCAKRLKLTLGPKLKVRRL